MQEKVSHAPPPHIQMIEGKPPAASWFKENIVHFYQTRSHIELLTDVMAYLQEMQSQQVEQSRGKPLPLKESYVPLPEKGSPSDISTRAAFNSMQGYIKTQIHYLEGLIHILMQGDPKLAQQLNPLLEQLQHISQSFPQLSQQQLQSLTQMMETLLRNVKDVPNPTQRLFWNQQLNMLHSLMSQNGANIKAFRREINELNGRSKMLIAVEELLQNIQDLLKKQPPSKEEFQELLSHLQNLANNQPLMDPEQGQALLAFFEQLGNFKNTKGTKLSELVADALVHNKLSEFIKANPNATPEQIKNFLKNFLKESNLNSSPLDFMQRVGSAFEDLLNKEGFPVTQSHAGQDFVSKKENKIEENPAFFAAFLAGFASDSKSVNNLARSAEGVSSKVSEEVQDNSAKREGLQSALSKLSAAQNIFGRTAIWTVGQSLQTGIPHPPGASRVTATAAGKTHVAAAAPKGAGAPAAGGVSDEPNLPSEFQNIILNKYMPGQESYLEALAFTLGFLNDGAMFGNKILEKLMGMDGASTQFVFNSLLHGTGTQGLFSGSASDAEKQLQQEINKANAYIQTIDGEIPDYNNQIATYQQQLNKNGNLTPEQKDIINDKISKLTDLVKNLKVTSLDLKDLQKILKGLTIHQGVDPTAPGFNVTSSDPDWQTHLSSKEDEVINGHPDEPGVIPITGRSGGGLVHCHALAQDFQQTYSDQSQTQQMMLQMHMTEIQQEWTVSSTVLQLLFQMYSTLAQGIYK